MTGYHGTRRAQMNALQEIAATETGLQQATTVTTILTASLTAFELIRHLARSHEDQIPDLFAAFSLSAGAAVEGREWLVLAGSSPTASTAANATVPPGTGPEEMADALAALSAVLADRLSRAAALATGPGDKAACAHAADAARNVHHLLAGSDDEPDPR